MFAYQLYSSRNFPPLAKTCKMLADVGITDTEGFGGLYADSQSLDATAAALSAAGIGMNTGHFGLSQIEQTPEWALNVARTLGMKRLYVPYIMPDDRPTDAQGWLNFGKRLDAAFEPIRAAGYGTGWHNHDFEFQPLPDGSLPQDLIFAGGPKLEVELDVAWVVRGGADPFAFIKKYGPRITAAHVKDIAASGQNADEDGWADIGLGTVPWSDLLIALQDAGCQHFVLEHDNPSDDHRFASRSLASLRKM